MAQVVMLSVPGAHRAERCGLPKCYDRPSAVRCGNLTNIISGLFDNAAQSPRLVR
jgi:hypothetical protein